MHISHQALSCAQCGSYAEHVIIHKKYLLCMQILCFTWYFLHEIDATSLTNLLYQLCPSCLNFLLEFWQLSKYLQINLQNNSESLIESMLFWVSNILFQISPRQTSGFQKFEIHKMKPANPSFKFQVLIEFVS